MKDKSYSIPLKGEGEALSFGTGGKKKNGVLHILSQRLCGVFFGDFAEPMGFVQNSTHYSNQSFITESMQCCINPKSYFQSMMFDNI